MNISAVDLSFPEEGVTVFFGDNGAGKSAIMESIAICFTERRRGDSYKSFVKHGETKSKIHLEGIYAGDPIIFDVELFNKKNHPPTKRSIQYKDFTYSNSECSPLLESFGLDYLQHIMFSLQGESNITDLKPNERTKVLKKIFDFELKPQLEAIDNITTQDQEKLLVLQTQYDMLKGREFTLQEEKAELTPVQIQQHNLTIEEAERKLKVHEQKYFQIEITKKKILELNTSITNLKAALAKAKEDEANGQRNIMSSNVTLADYNHKISQLEDPDLMEKEIQSKNEAIEGFRAIVSQNESLIAEKEAAVTEAQSRMMELSNHVEAHKKGQCPQCGQDTPQESLPSLERDHTKAKDLYQSIWDAKLDLQKAVNATNSTIAAMESDVRTLTSKKIQNIDLKKQYNVFISNTETLIANTILATTEKRMTITKFSDQLYIAEMELSNYTQDTEEDTTSLDLRNEKLRVEKILADNNIAKELNKNIRVSNAKLEEEKLSVETQKETSLQDINTTSNNLSHYRDCRRILAVELPNYIIVKACSKLEKHINSFIENVKPGMSVRLLQSRGGVAFYYSPQGNDTKLEDWMSTKMASGFERELLSAAWRVALAKAYSLDLLILDEVDSAASVAKSEKMFRELATLEGFNQLFIISHKPEIVGILKEENDKVVAYRVEAGEFTLQDY